MQPNRSLQHRLYHRLVPYGLRIKIWEARHRAPVAPNQTSVTPESASITPDQSAPDPDRVPREGASPAERYAVEYLGNTAVKNSTFAKAVIVRNATNGAGHAMLKTWVEYALGTNERGEVAVQTLQQHIDVKGTRALDIGCAYGGTPIAFALAGAEAYGVEIDSRLLELAKLNLLDHPGARCTLLSGDILQPSLADSMGHFDIITCDNVIEHVEKASELVRTIARLLTPDGVCQMGIPNAHAYSEVVRDGHYGLFGLTLLERDMAIEYFTAAGNDDYSVGEYCFTLDEYTAMFERVGLRLTLMDPLVYYPSEVDRLNLDISALPGVFQRQVAEAKIPAMVQHEVRAALTQYMAQFSSRYAEYQAAGDPTESAALGSRLLIDYRQYQWQVLVRHTDVNS